MVGDVTDVEEVVDVVVESGEIRVESVSLESVSICRLRDKEET